MTESKRNFPWPEDEIVASYRSALDKKSQLKILADLNVCKVQDIRELLIAHGETLPEVKWTVQEEAQLRQLAAEVKSATEIAELMGRTKKSIEQKLSKMHISLRRQPVMLEALPTEKDILKEKLTESVDNLDKSLKQAQEMAELAAKEANAVTPEVNLEDIIKDFERHHSELEIRRLREDAVSDTLLTLLFDTLYSTDLNASLETVFARFGIKLLDYLKER